MDRERHDAFATPHRHKMGLPRTDPNRIQSTAPLGDHHRWLPPLLSRPVFMESLDGLASLSVTPNITGWPPRKVEDMTHRLLLERLSRPAPRFLLSIFSLTANTEDRDERTNEHEPGYHLVPAVDHRYRDKTGVLSVCVCATTLDSCGCPAAGTFPSAGGPRLTRLPGDEGKLGKPYSHIHLGYEHVHPTNQG